MLSLVAFICRSHNSASICPPFIIPNVDKGRNDDDDDDDVSDEDDDAFDDDDDDVDDADSKMMMPRPTTSGK